MTPAAPTPQDMTIRLFQCQLAPFSHAPPPLRCIARPSVHTRLPIVLDSLATSDTDGTSRCGELVFAYSGKYQFWQDISHKPPACGLYCLRADV
ncbi:unnamed protein product [Protopolystoma xenopodis]|uniref:Uncharacterized protein n=1 Tax=Protopolystoma xenopodis TaxID=117903 RepID=A0A3S5CEM7_9PLAT|nr:unnamed protein product [Protopolystoma xenopodis]